MKKTTATQVLPCNAERCSWLKSRKAGFLHKHCSSKRIAGNVVLDFLVLLRLIMPGLRERVPFCISEWARVSRFTVTFCLVYVQHQTFFNSLSKHLS